MAPTRTSGARRIVNLVVVAVLGVALGITGYLAFGLATAPGPRDAAGWTTIDGLPDPRGETAVAVVGSRLYVAGGLTGVEFATSDAVSVLDAATETWSEGPSLPEPRHHAAAVAVGNDVYVSGGAAALGDGTPRPEVWVLRAGAAEWTAVASMPVGRFGHRMVEVDRLVYVVGGVDGPGAGSGDPEPGAVLVYDPVADTWSTAAPIPLTRDHIAVVAVDHEIWAIGGRAGGRNHVRVDVYDIATGTWRDGPALPVATSGAADGAIGGWILVSGGEDPGAGSMVDQHWRLDARARNAAAWLPLPAPPLTVHGAPGAALNGRFVIAGGASRAGGQSNTAWSSVAQVLLALP